jgi:hypothetical protein
MDSTTELQFPTEILVVHLANKSFELILGPTTLESSNSFMIVTSYHPPVKSIYKSFYVNEAFCRNDCDK